MSIKIEEENEAYKIYKEFAHDIASLYGIYFDRINKLPTEDLINCLLSVVIHSSSVILGNIKIKLFFNDHIFEEKILSSFIEQLKTQLKQLTYENFVIDKTNN